LLFFEKGTPTKEIWYYEHRLPEAQKSYSKTKGIQFSEFAPMIKWWNKRKKSEVAWKVRVEDLKRGFDLDVKNPNSTVEENDHTVEGLLHLLAKRQEKIGELVAQLESFLIGN
jgi:type I restriction enzyme M protein